MVSTPPIPLIHQFSNGSQRCGRPGEGRMRSTAMWIMQLTHKHFVIAINIHNELWKLEYGVFFKDSLRPWHFALSGKKNKKMELDLNLAVHLHRNRCICILNRLFQSPWDLRSNYGALCSAFLILYWYADFTI